MNQHPDNDLRHDSPRVEHSVGMTVRNSVADHREGMMAERFEDGSTDAAGDLGGTLKEPRSASGNAVLEDQGFVGTSMGQRLGQAERALADGEADHHQHQAAINARRASSPNAGNDEATVSDAISSVGPLSGIELVGIESSRKHATNPDMSPESVDGSHLSGTTGLAIRD